VTVTTVRIPTRRGDVVVLSLFDHAGEDPSILVSIDDADDTCVPTAEFTLSEAGAFRDELRRLCEVGARGR